MARLFVTGINLNKNELQNARIQNLSAAPSSPVLGQIYYDTSNNVMYYYNGLADPNGPWMPMSGSTEVIQDIVASTFVAGEGIDLTYSDPAGTITVDAELATSSNRGVASFGSTDFLVTDGHVTLVHESVQDIVGAMVSSNVESGISVTYDDTNGKLDFDVNDPTITLSGDVTGSGTLTNLGNLTITTTIEPNSVALGTDTTGDYVKSISGTTNEIEVAGSGGETATVTIGLPDNVTITDNLTVGTNINVGGNIVFEGPSIDANETTLTLANPTADNTITLPDKSGTVILDTNTVNSLSAPLASFSMNDQKITNLSAPTNPTDAANKAYVDEVAEGLKTKPAVEAATNGDLGATYSNGVNGVGATLTSNTNGSFPELDGHSGWQIGDGILVKNQTNAAQNGRYVLTTLGDGSNPWVLTRCGLCDEAYEIPGMYIFVKDGNTNANTGWVGTVENTNTFVVGTDAITFYQFSGAGTYTAGEGLTLTGTVFTPDVTPNAGIFAGLEVTQGALNVKADETRALTIDANGLGVNAGTGLVFSPIDGSITHDTTNGYGVRKKAFVVGNAVPTTSYALSHNLATRDVTVHIYETAAPHAQVEADIEHTDTSTITVKFATAPSYEQYRAVIVG